MEEHTEQKEESDPPFIALADQGKTRWHTYIVSVCLIGSIWIFGSIFLIVT